MSAQSLKKKLKDLLKEIPEVHAIRLHRAISWIKAAEDQERNMDLRLICCWIAANSLYAMDEERFEALQERERFADFVDRLIQLDHESRIYKILWNTFSGPVRLLISNPYVFGPFWEYQRNKSRDWKKGFEQSIFDANIALGKGNVNYLLRIVLDRLYVLRNQLIHGGATFNSKVNRAQVKDGANILMTLLPVFLDIMMENPTADWGKVYYPPVENGA